MAGGDSFAARMVLRPWRRDDETRALSLCRSARPRSDGAGGQVFRRAVCRGSSFNRSVGMQAAVKFLDSTFAARALGENLVDLAPTLSSAKVPLAVLGPGRIRPRNRIARLRKN